ncbi:HU family DNA-binding protein [Kineococcus sp. SYSU DK006]|uniref:HU family DNA-binding protein n=1 Tax=Kineococcus sp. SYSU DK006 TaxID=3383127 RepID=UPI003D7C4EE8
MNKAEMVDALEARLGGKKQAVTAVEAIVELITLTVAKGDKVAISGFGTFEKQARNARTGRNPRTGEAVKIKKTSVPRFRPGTAFKEVVSDTKALRAFQAAAKERATGTATGIRVPSSASAAPAASASSTTAKKAAPATRSATAGRTAPAAKKAAAAPARKTAAKSAAAAAPAARKAAPAKTATTTRRTAKKA